MVSNYLSEGSRLSFIMEKPQNKKSPRRGFIRIDRDTCKGCSLCISVCPQQVIKVSETLNEKGYYPAEFMNAGEPGEEHFCTGCATCAIICPDVAIEVYRE